MPEPSATHRAIEAVWKIESPRLIASLTRTIRDVGLAEELAQEAFLAALEQWPESGNPGEPRRMAHDRRPPPRY
jgi:predicted RNA polymerase sigma factor